MAIECAMIAVGNAFTIYVFWIHRKRLKRTSILLINLAIADLLLGLTEPAALATGTVSGHFEKRTIKNETTQGEVATILPSMFSFTSLFCLVHISLERAYAVIWPLRHRTSSTKSYICSVLFVWAAGMTLALFLSLHSLDVLSYNHASLSVCVAVFLSLVIICGSYLAIRTRSQYRDPAIHRNRGNLDEQNIKLTRTMFIVIAASFICWLPGAVLYFIYAFCDCPFPVTLLYSGTLFNIASSIVNPIIYNFRMAIFRETLKKFKLRTASRNENVN